MTGIVARQLFVRGIALVVPFWTAMAVNIPFVSAQGEPAQDVPGAVSRDAAHQNSEIRFSVESQSKLGAFAVAPGHWCDLHLRLENSGDSPRDLLCTSYFEADSNLQYGRQVWLPAHARLNLSHPALIPPLDPQQAQSLNVSSLVIERTAGNEQLVKAESGQVRHDRSLLLTPPSRVTGIISGGSKVLEVPQEVLDIVVACRVNQRLNNRVTILAEDFLPTDEISLRYLDHLVVADNRLTDDYAALTAVRRWLHGGGRLWIMLDRVDQELLDRILGDDFHGYVADRVGLTSLMIDGIPNWKNPQGDAGELLTFDEPVDMARLVVTGMKVWNTVEGWPAALTMPYGEGRVLITTVGPRAWIKPTPPSPYPVNDPLLKANYVPGSALEDLAAQILAGREPPLLSNADFDALAREYVAYKIPNWTLMAGAMAGLMATLLIAVGLLWRFQRLEHFGWCGSLLSILATVLLLGIGQTTRQGVAPTEASVQLAQAIDGTDDLRSHGAVAVYRTQPTREDIQTHQGGAIGTDMTGMEGVTRRLITTDLRTFHWEGVTQPVGLQLFSASTSRSYLPRYEVRATLNEHGLSGQFSGNAGPASDVMLATRFGRIGVEMSAKGAWSGGIEGVFESDQYLAATLLGTEQERRRRILEQLFRNKSWKNGLQRPLLLAWQTDWPQELEFGDGLTRQGQTLVVVPVDIDRPPTGTEMLIPSPLLAYGTRMSPDGGVPAGCWDDGTGEWQERSGSCVTWLSFQIPRTLLPVKALKAQLEVKVSGAVGRIEIHGIQNDAAVLMQEVKNPVGTVQVDLTDVAVLGINDDGELALGITAGELDRAAATDDVAAITAAASADRWKIESLGLNVWAKTTDALESENE